MDRDTRPPAAFPEAAAESQKRIESLTKNLLECYEELDLIYRLARRGHSAFEPQRHMEFILAEAMEIFEADSGWVVPSPGEPSFRPVTARTEADTVAAVQRALVDGLVEHGRSRMFYHLAEELHLEGDGIPGAFLASALRTEGGVYGALCVGRSPGRPVFTAGDLKLAGVLASQAAVALENAILHRKRMEEAEILIRLTEEVRLARTIQERLLPKRMPELAGYDIAGRTRPAQSVGGDYFDFIPMAEDKLALALGDVSGKGMPAALLMAHLQAAIRGQTLMAAAPAVCLARSNRLLYSSTDSDRFATCFYGILDARAHVLRYANAGHDRPLLVRGHGGHESLDGAGLVLGILEETGYDEVSLALEPGDVVVVYSDGIIDAADARDEAFGLERLTRLLEAGRADSAPALLDRVFEEVARHGGEAPQTDDMTLVVIRRQPV
jgi:sigma-B regulation protein RsbU (phosphoserine phosphatase)